MHEPELKPIIDVPVAAVAAQRILKDCLDAFVNGDWLPLSWWDFSDGLREDIADR